MIISSEEVFGIWRTNAASVEQTPLLARGHKTVDTYYTMLICKIHYLRITGMYKNAHNFFHLL